MCFEIINVLNLCLNSLFWQRSDSMIRKLPMINMKQEKKSAETLAKLRADCCYD